MGIVPLCSSVGSSLLPTSSWTASLGCQTIPPSYLLHSSLDYTPLNFKDSVPSEHYMVEDQRGVKYKQMHVAGEFTRCWS